MKRFTVTWGLFGALTAGLSACAVGPDFERPAAPTTPGYSAEGLAPETASADTDAGKAQRFVSDMDIPGQWWTLFRSPALNRLVEQALKANPNVAAAKAALRQARELYKSQWAAYFPTVTGELSQARAKDASGSVATPVTASNPVYSLYTAQLSLTYAPDVFGAQQRAAESAMAEMESSRFQLEAVYLTLSSNVVVAAVTEASLRGQIAATEHLLDLQNRLVEMTRGQRALGTASELDLLAQQSAEAQLRATLPPLQKQLAQNRDALAALLGLLPADDLPETFRLADLTLPEALPVSLPSRLVAQRPDIRQAEENFHAATAEVGIAIADELPQFSVTANTGSSGLKLDQVFTPQYGFWSFGTSLSQTLFDAGVLLHKRRAADAAMDQAAAQYKSTVILAFQNVADSLRAVQSDADALKATSDADNAAKRTYDLAREQYTLGTITLVALLNAEQALQQSELALVQAQANRFSDTVGLFQSLGGGWWNRPREAGDERSGPKGN